MALISTPTTMQPTRAGPWRNLTRVIRAEADLEITERIARRILFAIVLCYAGMQLWFLRGYYIDDLFIHARYARNLANGHGFAYNAGDGGSYGATSPLFAMFLAIWAWAGHPFIAAKAIDLLAALTNVVLTYALVGSLLDDGRTPPARARSLALVSAMLLAANPLVARWSFAGMETPLFLTALLATQLMVQRATARHHPGAYALAGVGLGLATLVRPEAFAWILAVGTALTVGIVIRRAERKQRLVGLLVLAGVCTLVAGAWFAYALHAFGTVVPNTVLAKGAAQGRFSAPLEPYARRFVVQFIAVAFVTVIPLTVATLLYAAQRLRGGCRWTDRWMAVLPNLLFLALFVGSYWANSGQINSRYLTALVPSMIVIGAVMIAGLEHDAPSRDTWVLRTRTVAVFTAVATIACVGAMVIIVAPYARKAATGGDAMVRLGEWLNTNTPPDSTVVAADIGVIGYYSERNIIDLNGLATRDLIDCRSPEEVFAYLQRRAPEYIAVRESRLPSAIPPSEQERLLAELFRVHVGGFRIGDNTEDDYVVYRMSWSAVSAPPPEAASQTC